MDQHSHPGILRRLGRYPVLAAFTLFFAALFALDLLTPDRTYSEMENTTLTQRPHLTTLSAKGLNDYFTDYTQYVKDQVFARDQWIGLQSLVETALQKTESGGILLGQQGQMFPATMACCPAEKRTCQKHRRPDGSVPALARPCKRDAGPFGLHDLPGKPAGPRPVLEGGYLAQLAQSVTDAGGRWLELCPLRWNRISRYIYYRTDHHWTTLGAYYAYQQLCDALGMTPFDRDAHTARSIQDFYGTHYSKARTWNAQPDTLTWYDLDNPLTIYQVTAPRSARNRRDHHPVRRGQAGHLRQVRHVPPWQQRPEPH